MTRTMILCAVAAMAQYGYGQVPGDTNGDGVRSPLEYIDYRNALEATDSANGLNGHLAGGGVDDLPAFSVHLLRNGSGQPILSDAGNWQWTVDVIPHPFSSSLAVELGVCVDQLTSATVGDAVWDTPNPGSAIFGWEMDNPPNGLQTNPATNELFMAYGSSVLPADSDPTRLLIVETSAAAGGNPNSPPSTTIDILGAYQADGINLVPGPPRDGWAIVAQQTDPNGVKTSTSLRASLTFVVPEPASWLLAQLAMPLALVRRHPNST